MNELTKLRNEQEALKMELYELINSDSKLEDFTDEEEVEEQIEKKKDEIEKIEEKIERIEEVEEEEVPGVEEVEEEEETPPPIPILVRQETRGTKKTKKKVIIESESESESEEEQDIEQLEEQVNDRVAVFCDIMKQLLKHYRHHTLTNADKDYIIQFHINQEKALKIDIEDYSYEIDNGDFSEKFYRSIEKKLDREERRVQNFIY